MKKLLLSFALMLLSIIAIKAQTSPAENPNAPDFKFDVEEYDFGNIKEGESINYEYKFTNIGNEPLIISTARGSCGCTVPDWPKEPIRKGTSGSIKVVFNSQGKSGMQRKTVTITSNAKTPSKTLIIKGNVIKEPVVSPSPEKKIEGGMPVENK